MDNNLIEDIAKHFQSLSANVLLVENNDGFLFRDDVITEFSAKGINIIKGTNIYQRVKYELRNPDELLILLSHDNASYLEDIKENSFTYEFFIKNFLDGYHLPTVINESLEILEKLYAKKQYISLTKNETQGYIEKIIEELHTFKQSEINLEEFSGEIDASISTKNIDWLNVSNIISRGLLETIGTDQFEDVIKLIDKVNNVFQSKVKNDYQSTKNSNSVKKPQIVSKILDYIEFNNKTSKIALIVIDGLSFWQYKFISKSLPGLIKEDVIYSWIPTITQLSRQAIFKGANPVGNYRQQPNNEMKLWKNYWIGKGFNKHEIRYCHQNINLNNLTNIKRFALVYKDLDDYMHNSKDYHDLLKLTENWLERSEIISTINTLLNNNFKVFIATDHGNIQAKGWRSLKGREKLVANKSGSRSQRHLEYSEDWQNEEFINNNPELKDSIVMDNQAIYFKDDLSFSREESLVTHGGAHILEVLIPFIELTNE